MPVTNMHRSGHHCAKHDETDQELLMHECMLIIVLERPMLIIYVNDTNCC